MLGCSSYSAQITDRGGNQVLFDIPWESISISRVLDASGDFSVSLGRQGDTRPCEEIMRTVEPYRHELLIYADQHVAAVGPVTSLSLDPASSTITANGLFHWLERRFFADDFRAYGDLAEVFKDAAETAIALEPSINLEVIARKVGILGAREVRGTDFTRVSDVLSELARTGLDFVQRGRQLLVGQLFDLMDDPLILTDDVISEVTIERQGASFATDIVVFGQTLIGQQVPVWGRATRQRTGYGLIQESFAEGMISDSEMAWVNARTRIEAMQPAPISVGGVLDDQAPVPLRNLFPGILVPARLYKQAITVDQEMLLNTVDIQVTANDSGFSQRVSVGLVPKGPNLALIAGLRGTTDVKA